ncbi:TPA: class I SAM-dependent methyltransferase [Yersinia enterocolitica]
MQIEKTILDMCCGSRMFWFDRADPRAVFVDIRAESHILCDGRRLEIAPDLIADFRQLPFADNTFQIVVFDPPHLTHCGPEGWQGKKYGILSKSWKDDLTKGFAEAFRVLRAGGVLIFKWNEVHIPTRDIIKLSPVPPIFGHPSGKRANTNWVCFQKPGENLIAQLEAAQKEISELREEEQEWLSLADIHEHLNHQNNLNVEHRNKIHDLKEKLAKAEAALSAANEKLSKPVVLPVGYAVRAGQPITKLHGLRMLNPTIFTRLPLASADSTNVARNIGIDSAWKGTYSPQSKETRASILVERIESFNGAGALNYCEKRDHFSVQLGLEV